jgi:hypothetical protein
MAIAAVGLSACAGARTTSTSTPTTTPSAVATAPVATAAGAAGTRADYLAKAKPICDRVTGIIDALPDPGDNQDEKLRILDQRAAALNEALAKLQGLPPPAQDQSTVTFIVDHLTAVRDDTSGQAAALRAGDTVKAGQLEARFDGDENIAKNAANDYGLGDCGA